MAERSPQAELDDLARANSWWVSSRPGKSVYTRGGHVVTLVFNEGGTGLLSMSRTLLTPEAIGKDWKGQAGNILRSRFRTVEGEAGS